MIYKQVELYPSSPNHLEDLTEVLKEQIQLINKKPTFENKRKNYNSRERNLEYFLVHDAPNIYGADLKIFRLLIFRNPALTKYRQKLLPVNKYNKEHYKGWVELLVELGELKPIELDLMNQVK